MAQAQANILLLEEDDEKNENHSLLNFYQGNLQQLKEVPLHRVPDRLKFDVAALHYGTSQYKNEWKEVLEDLGVNYIHMYAIDWESSNTGHLPIYLALNGILSSKRSFGDFTAVLCKREKYHILKHLKPFVEELKHTWNKEGYYSGQHPTAPDFRSLEVTNSLADSYGSEVYISTQHKSGYDSVTSQEVRVKYLNSHKTISEHFQNSEVFSPANNKQLSKISNFQSSQPVNESISVFIMHSMLDKKYAKKFAACLKEKNFKVITSANIYPYLRENPTMIMKAIDGKVDFVIPIVSESFMKQIKLTGYNATEEKDIECVANTFMYDRLLNEYCCQGNFFNRRVKPVCFSLESRKLKSIDQILSWSCYLPCNYLENDQLLEKELLQHLRCSKKRLELSK